MCDAPPPSRPAGSARLNQRPRRLRRRGHRTTRPPPCFGHGQRTVHLKVLATTVAATAATTAAAWTADRPRRRCTSSHHAIDRVCENERRKRMDVSPRTPGCRSCRYCAELQNQQALQVSRLLVFTSIDCEVPRWPLSSAVVACPHVSHASARTRSMAEWPRDCLSAIHAGQHSEADSAHAHRQQKNQRDPGCRGAGEARRFKFSKNQSVDPERHSKAQRCCPAAGQRLHRPVIG